MTALTKPVSRVVTVRAGAMIVTLTAEGVTFRQPRQRRASALLIPYGHALMRAEWLAADALKRERAAKRKARKGAR